MAIEDDIYALLQTVDAKIDIIQTEIVAIKAITDKIDFYPYIIISGTLDPNVKGDYFWSGRNEYGNIFVNYQGFSIVPTDTGFTLTDGSAAEWFLSGSNIIGTYSPVSGATGDATSTLAYTVLATPDYGSLVPLRSIPPASIIDLR